MNRIFSEENMTISVNSLLGKNDSCGIDGIYISEYKEYWEINKEKIIAQILQSDYEPGPVQMDEVLNKNGKHRRISKFTCTDRVILDVLKRELTPLWERKFSKYSYAYQANKGVQEAIKQVSQYIQEGNVWVAEIDIENFFSNINIGLMLEKLQVEVIDAFLIELVKRYLHINIYDDFSKYKIDIGLVQGSPLSPLFSNVYMIEFDKFLESKYKFCRFSDNINIYCQSEEEAIDAANKAKEYLNHELKLPINKNKSGIFSVYARSFLGYMFYKEKKTGKVFAKRNIKEGNYHNKWNTSAIQKIDRHYHIVNDGILTRKDYTILFENEEKKCYLPVETCGSINVYSKVIFSSSFFEFAKTKKLQVNLFDKCGEHVGSFVTAEHYDRAKTMLKQASIYNHTEKRLEIAKKIQLASLHNHRENLRYYYKRKKKVELQNAIQEVSKLMEKIKGCNTIEELMIYEARAKQKYLQAFDYMVDDVGFPFVKRSRRPPQNELNALISFGNVFMYQRIATEIQKTALDIRIGFVHATNNRSQSLNLDIAEIFKPIIVDRAIFTVIHNMEINKNEHFEQMENGGIYLNASGKRIFIRALEQKLYQKLSIKGTRKTYDTIIRDEIKKIIAYVKNNENYKPFKYT